MSDETKPYKTTIMAGHFVAGRRIPSVQDGDGNRAPQVGFLLHLTDAEAKYELLQGSIEPAETLKPGSKPAKSEAKEM